MTETGLKDIVITVNIGRKTNVKIPQIIIAVFSFLLLFLLAAIIVFKVITKERTQIIKFSGNGSTTKQFPILPPQSKMVQWLEGDISSNDVLAVSAIVAISISTIIRITTKKTHHQRFVKRFEIELLRICSALII